MMTACYVAALRIEATKTVPEAAAAATLCFLFSSELLEAQSMHTFRGTTEDSHIYIYTTVQLCVECIIVYKYNIRCVFPQELRTAPIKWQRKCADSHF